MTAASPLIVTLAHDAATQTRLDELRRRHYPATGHPVPAHTTLFHTLPGERLADVVTALARAADGTPAFALDFPTLRRFANGVAIVVDAEPLLALHARLKDSFATWLTPLDHEPYAPHVTIMNKRAPAFAMAAYNQLLLRWEAFAGTAQGLALWHYRGGPWELAATLAFTGA